MPIKLKTIEKDGATYAEVKDGKPVFIHDDGKEVPFDAEQSLNKIRELNAEAKGHREAKETAETKLKAYEGIDDPAAAIAAIQKLKDVDDGKLVAAGKVEEIRAAANKAAEDRIAAAQKKMTDDLAVEKERATTLERQLYDEKIGGSFARSNFVTEKLVLPPDIAKEYFGKHFKVEEGKIIAYDSAGNRIISRAKPGDNADFDEAIEQLVDAYPHKNAIMRGQGGGTGGRAGAGGGGQHGSKTLTRAEFETLNAVDKSAKMAEGYKVVDA
jgi:hypothetical protein